MITTEASPSKRRFAQDVLPWLIAVSAFVIYLVTLNHWLTLNNVSLAAKVAGWDWQPTVVQPALFLATLPFRCLPASWVPLALNTGTALCAALILALLARSVSLLPHDRFPDQQRLANNEQSLLLLPNAWVPPLLAALACGLQTTFWENAISASGEMLDVLLFAYIIRCLLEYRLEKKPSWLDRAALAGGVAMANNWGMVFFLPLLFIAAVLKFFKFIERRPHGTADFVVVFPTRALLRLGLFGLAGLSLFLLLPLVQALSADSPLSFWEALGAETASYRNGIRFVYEQFFRFHREEALLLALSSLLPVVVMSIRSRTFSINDRTDFGLGAVILLGSHAGLLMVCLWAAFDPFFSPHQIARNLGVPLSFLTLYYLMALSIGYYSGFFLLLFGASSWGRRWSLQKALQWTVPKGVYLLIAVAAGGLFQKNLPVIQAMNWPHLRQYGQLTIQSLPAEGAIVLSGDRVPLLVLQATLASQGQPDRYVPVDMQSLPSPRYQKHLRRKFPQRWPEPVAQTSPGLSQPATNTLEAWAAQVQLLTGLSQTNRLFYLHPACGNLFELFYLEPRGLVYELKRYPTNALGPPPLSPTALTNNLAFWDRTIETVIDPLRMLITGFEQPRPGSRKRLMDWAHLEMPVPFQFKAMGRWYGAALNSWGVTLQRSGRLSEAARCFKRAQELNTDNLAARFNFQCNSNLLAGRKLTVAQSASLEELTGRNRALTKIIAEDGLVDDPSFCFQMGIVFAKNRLFRQAGQQFERVKALVSGDISARLNLGGLFNLWDMPDKTRALLAEIRADPTLQPLAPAVEKEIAFLEVEEWFSALRTTHQQLRVNPDDVTALVNEGISFIRLGACSNAIPPLSRALALTNSPMARFNRAFAYLKLGELDAAQTDYLELQQSQPKDFRIYYGLGEIACRRKDTNAAIRYFQSCLANAETETEETKFVAARLKALQQSSH